ncbi:MAG: hypothetical protein P9F75_18690 [Candidatus Contendobacter sp.]|nr:hypothetical protein [Candidatus Contendobacter sp.]
MRFVAPPLTTSCTAADGIQAPLPRKERGKVSHHYPITFGPVGGCSSRAGSAVTVTVG